MHTHYHTIQMMRLHGGSFVRGLSSAAYHADALNYDRLQAAFPEIWERYGKMVPEPTTKEQEAGK